LKIIGLSGFPGSGKDTAAEALLYRGWKRLAFGDKLKQGAIGIDPIVGVEHQPWWRRSPPKLIRLNQAISKYGDAAKRKFPEVRRFYQRYGTEGGRDVHGRLCWIKIIERQLLEFIVSDNPPPGVVITDVRFPEEHELIKGRSGSVYYIERSGLDYAPSHSSEQYQFPFDGKIVNDWEIDRLHNDILALAGYHDLSGTLSGDHRRVIQMSA